MIDFPALSKANQARAMLLGYLMFSALYLGSAGLHLQPPLLLQPGPVESAMPFIDWSVWIYLSQFGLLVIAIVYASGDQDRSRVFYAMLLATVLASMVFVVMPTYVERPIFAADGLTGAAWMMLYGIDTRFNCFPSLHAALAALAGIVLWRRGWRTLAVAWPGFIIISTLTTRQHVAWDVVAGLLLATAVWIVTPRLIRYG